MRRDRGACGLWLVLLACEPMAAVDESSEESASPTVAVTWIDVVASDYTLELVPAFDRTITEYEAIANGPGIEVWVDVIVDAEVEGVSVNGVPASLAGFRLWRSAPETDLVSPTTMVIEVEAGDSDAPRFEIDVVYQ